MRAWFVTIAVAWPGLAHAEIPMYPTELTDRPIVLLPGMTTLDVSLEFRTHVYTVIDEMGNSMLQRTGFFDRRTPDIGFAHAFGGVEIDVSLGEDAFVGARLDLGLPVVFIAAASFGVKQPDSSYSEAQRVAVDYKWVVAPHLFALAAGAGVGLNERRDVFATGAHATGVELFASAGVSAEAQVTRGLGIYTNVAIGGPFVESSLDTQTSLSVSAEILYALHRWDFYLDGSLGNVTRGHPSTFLSLGFVHRWGI